MSNPERNENQTSATPSSRSKATADLKADPDITLPLYAIRTSVYDTIYDAEQQLITFVGMSDVARARAELIVKSVNAHDALMKALSHALSTKHDIRTCACVNCKDARAALALATQKEDSK